MTLSEKQCVFFNMVSLLGIEATNRGLKIKLTEWFRSPEKQLKLLRAGKTWTLNSAHIHGLAIDIAIIKDGRYIVDGESYRPLGEYWKELTGIWGGDWKVKDYCHFEYTRNQHKEG